MNNKHQVEDLLIENFKSDTKKFSDQFTYLFLIVLAISFTYYGLNSSTLQLNSKKKNLESQLNLPWVNLQTLFEQTEGDVDVYLDSIATPWSKSLMTVYLTHLLHTCVTDSIDLSPEQKRIKNDLNLVSYSMNTLNVYIKNLNDVKILQEKDTKFKDLDRKQLKQLLDAYQFRLTYKKSKYDSGMLVAKNLTPEYLKLKYFNYCGDSVELIERTRNYLNTSIKLEFYTIDDGENIITKFKHFADTSYQNPKKADQLAKYLEKGLIVSLGDTERELVKTNNEINQLKLGRLYEIPIIGIKVTVSEIGFISVLINIFFLVRLIEVSRKMLQNYTKLASESKNQVFLKILVQRVSFHNYRSLTGIWQFGLLLILPIITIISTINYKEHTTLTVMILTFLLVICGTFMVMLISNTRQLHRTVKSL